MEVKRVHISLRGSRALSILSPGWSGANRRTCAPVLQPGPFWGDISTVSTSIDLKRDDQSGVAIQTARQPLRMTCMFCVTPMTCTRPQHSFSFPSSNKVVGSLELCRWRTLGVLPVLIKQYGVEFPFSLCPGCLVGPASLIYTWPR